MKRLSQAIALLAGLSCSDSSGPNLLGTLTFTFTGAGGGTFTASGNAPSLGTDAATATTWALGLLGGGEVIVAGSKPRSGGLVDLAIVRIDRATTGSENIDSSCDIDASALCTGMVLYLNFNGNGDSGDLFCGLVSGSAAITEISTRRAKGTFSGTGNCVDGVGGDITSFSVTNGSFDVALSSLPAQ